MVSPTQKLRAGIIGLGMASAPHALSLLDLKDKVDVAGAFGPTEARRTAFAQRFGLPVVDSADAIFDDPSIDYVVILTPPNSHLDLVKRAAKAGKHVLLEKPLEISLERSRQVVETAERAAIKLGVVLQRRFRPAIAEAARLIGEGKLGEIVSASMRLGNWRPQSYYDEPGRGTLARDGGGVLLTQAIHTIDQLIALAGLPTQVTGFAITSPVHSMETEDVVHAALRFGNGALGALSATTAAYPGFPDVIEILGTLGTARLEGDGGTINLMDGRSIELKDASADGGNGADPMAFSHSNHRAVHEDFLNAITTGRQCLASGLEALKAHRLIDAILRASTMGEAVRV
ncbi:Gfo/Idh/MocA family oxidoreductase [Pararhizobium sp. YC-54]|uniref:Gfo/Idh/MocA family protein n=1 Tax=Pararhizobium sp. YC-54 TaxID=2986920 RepID=UPI0021F72DD1|nr:Gfo/Idh/MocA family oxidoreductase [Pararhizobium sp. YC-54]MCW0000307.1 Gfo/Idh/MocA family oxidoreductase [Pararhizobium sp. YC-54]